MDDEGLDDEEYAATITEDVARPRPQLPELSQNPRDVTRNLQKIVDFSRASERYDISERIRASKAAEVTRRREENAKARKIASDTGAKFIQDERGYSVPDIDPTTGRQKYIENAPVRYDEKGRPFRHSPQGEIVNPDADADFGENPDDPNDPFIYRKNKATPWEPIDPEEGIKSGDRRVMAASARFLHKRELEKAQNERADISLKLQDPARPRGLTEKQRLDLTAQREALAEQLPRPEPKKGLFGGINQQATAAAEATWMQEEEARKAQLAGIENSLVADDERLTLEKQSYDLAVRQKTLRDAGPAGFLKMRLQEQADSVAALPPEEASARLQEDAQSIDQEDAAISTRKAELEERSAALNAEMKPGVSFARSAEIDRERATLQSETEDLNAAVTALNTKAEQIRATAQTIQEKQKAERKAEINKLREQPETAQFADEFDALDAEIEQRMAEVQKIEDPEAQKAAVEVIRKEAGERAKAIESELGVAQRGGFPKSFDQVGWDEADKTAWDKLPQDKKRLFAEEGIRRKQFDDVKARRDAIVNREFAPPENWDTLSAPEKKRQLEEFQADKEGYLRAFDNTERRSGRGEIIKQLSDGVEPGDFFGQLGRQIEGRTRAALSSAGASLAAPGTGVLDLATAAQAAFGKEPDETWTRQVSSAIRDFYDSGMDGDYRDAAATKLVGGLASALSFLAPGGIIGKVAGGGARAITASSAITGAVMNGGAAYSEALDMGLRPEQAFARLATGMGLGATEAFGVGGILAKIDRISRGSLGKFFRNLVTQGAEEGAQEAFQSAGQDLADLLILDSDDPRRKTLAQIASDAKESGLWGAATGILFTGLVDAAARRDRRSRGLPEVEPDTAPGETPSAFRPEMLAAAQAQVDTWQPPEGLTPEAVDLERTAARASLKLLAGQPLDSLLAAERAALGQKLPDKSPRMEVVDGTAVLTDGQLARLRQVVPMADTLPIRDEATVRADLAAQKETPDPPAETAPEAGSNVPRGTQSDQSAGLPPLPVGKFGALVTPKERGASQQLQSRLSASGVDAETAKAYADYFVRREGTTAWGPEKIDTAMAEFETSGGRTNPEAIRRAVWASQRSQLPEVEAILAKVISDLGEAYTNLTDPERTRLDSVIRHRIAPELLAYTGAVREIVGNIVAQGGGGVGVSRGMTFNFNVGDILKKTELSHLLDDAGVERTVQEEIAHLANITALAKIRATRTGDDTDAFDAAMAEAAEIFQQIPKEVRSHVQAIYGNGNDATLGMEFFRMLLQRDIAVEDGKFLTADGVVLTEQTLAPDFVERLREVFRRLLATFGEMRSTLTKQLQAEGRPQEEIATLVSRIDEARKESVDVFRKFQKSADAKRRAAYEKAYAGGSSTTDATRGRDGQPAPAGGLEGDRRDAGGDRGDAGMGEGTQPGDRPPVPAGSPAAATDPAVAARLAKLEAEKAEREAREERALERRNLAVQRRAEASGSKDAILAQVPDEAKTLAQDVLSRVQMGSPTYVLGANRERLPASYVAAAPGTVQPSHAGADFHKNPLYGGENTRPYHTDETEQNKVRAIALPGALDEDAVVTDAKSAADGPAQVVLAIFNDTEGQLRVSLQTAGGNGREQGINLAPLEDQERLSAAWSARGGQFGLSDMPDGWRGYRFLGVFDLRNEARNREYLQLVDKLNPNQGVVQDTAARADIDAALNIPVSRLVDLPLTLSPEQAREFMVGLVRDAEKLGLDRNLVAGLVRNPSQSQFYIQRLLIASAFRSKALGEFFASAQWTSGHATVSGLIKSGTSTALRLREKGQGNIADAIGRTLERVTENVKTGRKLNLAIREAADQQDMGEDGPLIQQIADAISRKVAFHPQRKTGVVPVDSEESMAGFDDFFTDLARGVERFSAEPDLLGEAPSMAQTIRAAIEAHFRKNGVQLQARGAETATPRRIRDLQRKRQTDGLTRRETDELTQLERESGQNFLEFFDRVREDRFQLEQQSPIPTITRALADQGFFDFANGQLQARAYHGTPHKVDRFSTEKIGTGEGAQVYGWGLYFAENEAVAENYQNAGETGKPRIEFDGSPQFPSPVPGLSPVASTVVDYISSEATRLIENNYPAEKVMDAAIERARNFDDEKYVSEATDWIRANLSKIKPVVPTGNTYTVDLDVEAEDLLDWDKPLSEQSEKFQKSFGYMRKKLADRIEARRKEDSRDMESRGLRPTEYEALETKAGSGWYGNLSEFLGSPQKASDYLRDIGIPGIRYLDGRSRGKFYVNYPNGNSFPFPTKALADQEAQRVGGIVDETHDQDQTWNYVIFDDSKIRILEENGRSVSLAEVAPAPAEEMQLQARTAEDQDQAYLAAVESGDMETAQRMVDEAARLRGYDAARALHGSGETFDTFSHEQGGKVTEAESAKIAFFFTDGRNTAMSYARKAATFSEDTKVSALLKRAERAEKVGNWDLAERLTIEAEALEFGEGARERREEAERENAKVYDVYLRGNFMVADAEGNNYMSLASAKAFAPFNGKLTRLLEYAREQGFEGVELRNFDDAINTSEVATHWAVFSPNQIKSADPVTRDADGNVIPLSQRFNPESDSILQARSATTDPNQETFDFDAVPEDRPAAQADGEKFPLDRFKAELPRAMQIANSYTIVGTDPDEIRQRARLALADAARTFDPARGRPFAAYASVVVNNRLRDLARQENRRASRSGGSLDEPVGDTGTETRGDFATDPTAPSALDNAARDEAQSLLESAIDTLPAPMQTAVRGFQDGRTLDDIAQELGVAKQRVGVMQKEAFRRLRGKLGERGVNSVTQLLARGATTPPLAPNGNPSNLTETQWQKVRTPAFKEWFGDWEEVAKANALRGPAVATVQMGAIVANPGEKASQAAVRWLRANPQEDIYRRGLGEVVFDEKSISDSLGHGFSGPKLNSLTVVRSAIERGVELDQSMDFEGKPIRNWVVAAPIELDGKRHILFVRIRNNIADPSAAKRFYVHEILLEEQVTNEEASPFKTGSDPEIFRGKKSGGTGFYLSLARRAFAVNPDSVSQAVDENGEPAIDQDGNFLNTRTGEKRPALGREDTLGARPSEDSSNDDDWSEIDAMLRDLDTNIPEYASNLMKEMAAEVPWSQEPVARERQREAAGQGKKAGRPDLANISGDENVRAEQDVTDLIRQHKRERQEVAQWESEGRRMFEQDPEGTKIILLEKAQKNDEVGNLTAAEVVATRLLVEDLTKKSLASGDLTMRNEAMTLRYALREARSETARSMRAMVDVFKNPADRHREYLANTIYDLPAARLEEIKKIRDPRERQAKLQEATDSRIARIEKELATMGVSLDDIFNHEVYLRLRGAKIMENAAAWMNPKQQKAIQMIQDRHPQHQIRRVTGLSDRQIEELRVKLRNDLKAKLREKVAKGAKLEDFDAKDGFSILQARSADEAARMTDSEIEAELDRILDVGFGLSDHYKTNKFKIRKIKGKTPSSHVVGWDRPIFDSKWDYRFDIKNVIHAKVVSRTIEAMEGDFGDKVKEVWYSNILSGMQTLIANMSALPFAAYGGIYERAIESIINANGWSKENATMGEFRWLLQGLKPGIARAWSNAQASWITESGFAEEDLLNEPPKMVDLEERGLGYRVGYIKGQKGRVLRWSSRFLLAQDDFCKTVIAQVEVAMQAYRLAKAQGKEGQEIADYIRDEVNDPTSLSWKMAWKEAEKYTFTSRLPTYGDESKSIGDITGKGANFLNTWVKNAANTKDSPAVKASGIILQMFWPFQRTPFNILREGVRRSPLGAVGLATTMTRALRFREGKWELNAEVPPELVQRASSLFGGAMLFGLISALAGEGGDDDDERWFNVTGATPWLANEVGKTERELGYRRGMPAYSIRIFNRIYNYGRLEPFASILGSWVDFFKLAKRKARGQSWGEVSASFINYNAASLNEKSYMRGFSDFGALLQGEKKPPEWAANQLASIIVPNLLRQPMRNFDEFVRDHKDAGFTYDVFPMAGMPWTPPARRDLYGRQIRKDNPENINFITNAMRATFDVTRGRSVPEVEKYDQMLANWNRRHPGQETGVLENHASIFKYKSRRTGEMVDMTPGERDKFSENVGRVALSQLRLKSFNIENPTEKNIEEFRETFSEARRIVRQRMFGNR